MWGRMEKSGWEGEITSYVEIVTIGFPFEEAAAELDVFFILRICVTMRRFLKVEVGGKGGGTVRRGSHLNYLDFSRQFESC